MRPISDIAESMGLDVKEIIPYGRYKAKIPLEMIRQNSQRGKLVVVTGITPTRAGEGKTTTVVGLTQGLGKLGKNVVATLREPSLGPIFGIKGGGTGGGKSRVMPEDEINIHFTGDAHAVGSAHNLLSVLTDNAVQRGRIKGLDPTGITWRRVTDVEDRALRTIVTGIGGSANAPVRETGFDIVTASEIMALLALSSDLEDLRARLNKIVVGFTSEGQPVTAEDIGAVGSMMSLLRYAIQPNLVQTTEGQPVIVHTGPFGNIAHGCSSVVGDRLSLGYADYVLTEAGFGADLGFEKFMHIKARFNDLEPSAAVLVATVRALKSHGGVRNRDLDSPNEEALRKGMPNLEHLIGVVRSFGLPVVIAINHFPSDTTEEIAIVKELSEAAGAFAAVEIRGFAEGGAGGAENVSTASNGVLPAVRGGSHRKHHGVVFGVRAEAW
ncbi:MAG: formate--tetrahydrofolate ligase [Chloroflexi bacterium]|nr:formate--tetrahydrofolate ligase [Chloroflexota bacterium]